MLKNRSTAHRILALSLAVGSVATAALSGAAPAAAASRYGCVYPRVCFYLHESDFIARRPTAAYQDMTSAPQVLGSRSAGSEYVYNSRNDDGAQMTMDDGSLYCVKGGTTRAEQFLPFYVGGSVQKIKIVNSRTC